MSYASVVRDQVTSSDSLSFTPRTSKQPLYRPAVLRHNSSNSESFHLHSPSPPLSPAASSSDLKSSFFSGILGFDSTAAGRGSVLPKSQWKPDEETSECSDSSCSTKFGLIDRKHHCRRCGYIFCSTHSSHSIPLWSTNQEEASAPNTPRMTPRSSALDIPSLINSSRSSSPSPSLNSSLRRASPPTHPRAFPTAITCRVCDSCAFFNPYPPSSQITPLFTSPSSSTSPPLSFRHPSNSARSPTMSPAISPPYSTSSTGLSFGNSRSRQNSGSSSSDATSTAPSSLEGYISGGMKGVRGVSPANSSRAGIRVVREEESDSEDEEESYNEADERERRATFGSVIDSGEFSWQSRFATF